MSSPQSDTMSKDSKELTESSIKSADSPRTEDSNITAPTKISSAFVSPKSASGATDEKPILSPPSKRRAASEREDDSDEGHHMDVAPKSHHQRADSGDSAVSASQVCVCQPDPKIPRPPNAFILYRQHHQANLIAQYPGLKNPEISKIIGEQWRGQTDDEKSSWKLLAEEAKARHAAQYPDYKYQPKRNGRLPGSDPNDNTPTRCPKCGGRTMSSINHPGPIGPSQTSRPTLPPSARSTDGATRYRSPVPEGEASAKRNRGRLYPPSSVPVQPYPAPEYHDDGVSPESKRRRLDYGAQPLPMPVPARPPMPMQYPAPSYRQHPSHYPRVPPTRTSYLPSGIVSTKSPPPPPQSHHPHSAPPPHPPPDVDRSLTLPPIQTAPPDSAPSVEETVMQMPYLGKVSLLGKIAPPLKGPKPGERPFQARGPLVAVEADDPNVIGEIVDYLDDLLCQNDDFAVKTFKGPTVPRSDQEASFSQYIGVVQEWHAKSKEISEYMTTRQPPISERTRHDTPPEDPDARTRTPVVLLKGYSVLASNKYSSSIPINDVYTVIDHWQWMATMWRGIIGPDITVYVRDATPEEMGRDKVEVREDARCLVLKRERTANGFPARTDGGSLRRLGFEIGEWIRDVESMSRADVEVKSRRPST